MAAKRKSKRKPGAVTPLHERRRKLTQVVERVGALKGRARWDDALALLDKHNDEFGAVPDFLDIRAMVLLGHGEADAADRALRQAIKSGGRTPRRLSLLGFAWHQRGDDVEALKCHVEALERDPKDFHTYANMAHTLEELGKFDDAQKMLRTAYDLSGGDPQVIHNLATLLMTKGEIVEGAHMFEAAFATGGRTAPIDFRVNYWKGEDLSDKTILVWREFGIGDEIRNANMIPDLAAAADHVVFECTDRLLPLFQRSFPEVECIAQDNDNFQRTKRPAFDYHVGIDSLLRHFRPTIDAFPDEAGYLKPDPERVALWRQRFEALDAERFVGISWSSSLVNKMRQQYYITLDRFAEIGRQPGVALINLFYAADEAEMMAFEQQTGIRVHRWDDIDLRNDLDEVAAMTKALDLVVTVANSNHDIAGAVGTEHWVLCSPHWVVMHGSDHIPYYARARVYLRQRRFSYDYVFDKLNADFQRWLGTGDAEPLRRAG